MSLSSHHLSSASFLHHSIALLVPGYLYGVGCLPGFDTDLHVLLKWLSLPKLPHTFQYAGHCLSWCGVPKHVKFFMFVSEIGYYALMYFAPKLLCILIFLPY